MLSEAIALELNGHVSEHSTNHCHLLRWTVSQLSTPMGFGRESPISLTVFAAIIQNLTLHGQMEQCKWRMRQRLGTLMRVSAALQIVELEEEKAFQLTR